MQFDPEKIFARFWGKALPAPSVLGIDIGTSAIKAVVMTRSPQAPAELNNCAVELINGDLLGALKKILERLQFSSQVPVTAVSGKGTLIRYVDMPRMPLEDLRKAFVYDLDKYFPFDPQSIYTDCSILDPQSKDKRMMVLVAAVKKEMVDERLKLFKDAGVDLSHITINSIAIANAFECLAPAAQTDKAKAVLDIGGTVSSLLILQEKSPRFTRDIFIGSQEMTKQIASILGIDPVQAEQLKCAPGERAAEVVSACETALTHLIGEIRLSLDYFMTEKNVQIDELYLLGGGSLLKGIETLFEKNLGLGVKTWDPAASLKIEPQLVQAGSCSSQLAVAIGLGLTPV